MMVCGPSISGCEVKKLKEKTEKYDVLDEHFPRECCHVVEEATRQTNRKARLPGSNPCRRGGVLKPGEEYRIWNGRDVLGTLPDEYEMVVGRGARWVGVSIEYLNGLVEKYEKRIARGR